MLTYSVVVGKDYEIESDEYTVNTYSNKGAAEAHQRFIEGKDLIVDDYKWDYVFIRSTLVADIFVEELFS